MYGRKEQFQGRKVGIEKKEGKRGQGKECDVVGITTPHYNQSN
jgi:hypothetical protein